MQHYFVSKKDQYFILSEEDFHHVKNVMRMKENEQFICIFEHKKFLCAIHYLPSSYEIEVLKELEQANILPVQIHLYQALIKNDKFDFVIQKATELGVNEITPMNCARSIIKVDEQKVFSKLQRYQKIIKEACEQSTRVDMPIMNHYCNLKDIILDSNTLGMIAYEKKDGMTSLHDVLKNIKDYPKVAIVIGPEGGFEPQEVELLTQKGFKVVSLGNRILRSETAALSAIAITMHYIEGMGD